ncbi:MAG: hypothetical protein ABIG61_02325 [Planctomycetota bacterium]
MVFWIVVWTVLLIIGLAVFAVLAVVVTIGGFFDVRSLFRKIDKQHEEKTSNNRG